MIQYSFLLKNISCFIYITVYETSSEKIEKLHELSLFLYLTYARTSLMTSFSVTIDCVRFPIRRFPLYTYSMVTMAYGDYLHFLRDSLISENTNFTVM